MREYRDAGFQSGQVRHSPHVSTFTWGAIAGWRHTQNTSSTRDSLEVSCSTAARIVPTRRSTERDEDLRGSSAAFFQD